ncbi:65-kDa microtubule-associated protein 5 [Citrus sinensis]|uniref:65-kDa microtubule-associated protein 5 n=1 Tax=Citrus sinensis TaxID=2711 RepID=A0ACB8KDH7_CITSI|nr:65-kDa microtubule-associated protein 5 [Citrus sinensis]
MPSPTTCGSLLQELQVIWDEIGESDSERDKMLLELEQDCLDIYRRKVERTRKYKADLHQSLADAEAEIACLVSALGEHASFSRGKGTLKQQISAIRSILEDLRSKKEQRIKEFSGIQFQIAQISSEIAGNGQSINSVDAQVDECDLTVKKLGELKAHLRELQNEKNLRLQKVNNNLSTIHELSLVLSINFLETVNEVHPSLSDSKNVQSKSISNDTIARLTGVIHLLKQEKQQRLQKLQSLGNALIKLWDLLETPVNEQRKVDHVTSLVSSSVDEVSMLGCLALDVIEQMEVEVEHLNEYKASKMKELVFKRQHELEEIYKGVHMDVDSDAARQILISLIDSGNVDLSDLLSSMDDQIAKAKEESLSRKDILDKVEKWKHGAKEEQWLDDYEKVNIVGKLFGNFLCNGFRSIGQRGAVVENLIAKVKAWEAEKRIPFLYDKVPLLSILEEYTTQCQKREEEKRRCREQKRLQEQFAAEQEAIYGSRPSIKKPLCQSTSTNTMAGTPVGRRFTTPSGRHVISGGKERRESIRVTKPIPLNYVALPKDDSVSH